MFLRRLKHMLIRLTAEEKVIAVGSLVILFSAFMPWYSVVLNFDKGVSENGFSGDLGVIGFVVFLMTLLTLVFLVGDYLNFKMPQFGFSKESVLLFLSGETAFLLLLVVAIFTKRSLDYTNAELRFGLYTALIGSVFSAFAAFAQIQKMHKKEARAFFTHDDEPLQEEDEKMEESEEKEIKEPRMREEKKQYYREAPAVKIEAPEEPIQQELLVEEPPAEKTLIEEVEEEVANEIDEPYFPQELPLEPEAAPREPEAEEKPKPNEDQPSKSINRDMGFYNDL